MREKGGKIVVISKNSLGIAGEYFVAAELSRRGYITSLTLKNTKGIDILVANESSTKVVGVQVKANRKKNKYNWILGKKSEEYVKDNMFYVFVYIPEDSRLIEYFIVPSKRVAYEISETHKQYIDGPGKNGIKHSDTSIRTFTLTNNDESKDNWDLIERYLD